MILKILLGIISAIIVYSLIHFAYHVKLQLERNCNNEIDPDKVKFTIRDLIEEEVSQKGI